MSEIVNKRVVGRCVRNRLIGRNNHHSRSSDCGRPILHSSINSSDRSDRGFSSIECVWPPLLHSEVDRQQISYNVLFIRSKLLVDKKLNPRILKCRWPMYSVQHCWLWAKNAPWNVSIFVVPLPNTSTAHQRCKTSCYIASIFILATFLLWDSQRIKIRISGWAKAANRVLHTLIGLLRGHLPLIDAFQTHKTTVICRRHKIVIVIATHQSIGT